MTTNFLIKALTIDSFHELMLKNNEELKLVDAAWFTVDAEPGYRVVFLSWMQKLEREC